MPRVVESFEQRVLAYFQTAPLVAAQLLLSLAVAAVKSRKPKGPVKGTKKVHLVEEVVPTPAPVGKVAKPKKAKGKKSHHKKKPVQTKAEIDAILNAEMDAAHLEGEG